MGGGFFDTGGVQTPSTLSGPQKRLLNPLSQMFLGQLGGVGANLTELNSAFFGDGGLLEQLQRDTTGESKAMAERLFRESLLDPALRSFHSDIAPQIGAAFGNIGGSLSSRRGHAIAEGLTGVHDTAQAALAAQLPAIHAFPLQQTLSQIQGLSSGYQSQLGILAPALQFALTGTKTPINTPPGPGFGLLGDALGAGAYLGGAKIGAGA